MYTRPGPTAVAYENGPEAQFGDHGTLARFPVKVEVGQEVLVWTVNRELQPMWHSRRRVTYCQKNAGTPVTYQIATGGAGEWPYATLMVEVVAEPLLTWEEILRLVQTLDAQQAAVDRFSRMKDGLEPLDPAALPVDYVADAHILTRLLKRLEALIERP